MMVGNEKMNLTFKERIPAEYKRNAYNFIATPELQDIGIIDRMFQSAWEIARQKTVLPRLLTVLSTHCSIITTI